MEVEKKKGFLLNRALYIRWCAIVYLNLTKKVRDEDWSEKHVRTYILIQQSKENTQANSSNEFFIDMRREQ